MSELPVNREETPRVLDFTGVTLLGIPGVPGIISVNGDVTPAQVLAAGTAIAIVPGPPGTNTIVNTAPDTPDVKSINGDTTAAQILAAGTNVTITPGPPGTHTIAAPAINSINGDTTPAQVLAAGTGISIVPGPAGTNTINNTLGFTGLPYTDNVLAVPGSVASGGFAPALCTLTALAAGTYLFIGQISWGIGTTNSTYGISIELPLGNVIAQMSFPFVPPGSGFAQCVTGIHVGIVPADVVSLFGQQFTGAAVGIAAFQTFLKAVKLA